jgi:hypothetical protein
MASVGHVSDRGARPAPCGSRSRWACTSSFQNPILADARPLDAASAGSTTGGCDPPRYPKHFFFCRRCGTRYAAWETGWSRGRARRIGAVSPSRGPHPPAARNKVLREQRISARRGRWHSGTLARMVNESLLCGAEYMVRWCPRLRPRGDGGAADGQAGAHRPERSCRAEYAVQRLRQARGGDGGCALAAAQKGVDPRRATV